MNGTYCRHIPSPQKPYWDLDSTTFSFASSHHDTHLDTALLASYLILLYALFNQIHKSKLPSLAKHVCHPGHLVTLKPSRRLSSTELTRSMFVRAMGSSHGMTKLMTNQHA